MNTTRCADMIGAQRLSLNVFQQQNKILKKKQKQKGFIEQLQTVSRSTMQKPNEKCPEV